MSVNYYKIDPRAKLLHLLSVAFLPTSALPPSMQYQTLHSHGHSILCAKVDTHYNIKGRCL